MNTTEIIFEPQRRGDAEVLQGPGRGKKRFKHFRDGGRDCVELMEQARSDASVLEEALRAMGFTEANDNFPDGECRTERASGA